VVPVTFSIVQGRTGSEPMRYSSPRESRCAFLGHFERLPPLAVSSDVRVLCSPLSVPSSSFRVWIEWRCFLQSGERSRRPVAHSSQLYRRSGIVAPRLHAADPNPGDLNIRLGVLNFLKFRWPYPKHGDGEPMVGNRSILLSVLGLFIINVSMSTW
jgi:hypothetical protein